MSACISRKGEFSSHTIGEGNYICDDCGVLDEDGIFAELDDLRAKVRAVEALADEWTEASQREQEFADRHQGYYLGVVGARRNCRDHLLAALAQGGAS